MPGNEKLTYIFQWYKLVGNDKSHEQMSYQNVTINAALVAFDKLVENQVIDVVRIKQRMKTAF